MKTTEISISSYWAEMTEGIQRNRLRFDLVRLSIALVGLITSLASGPVTLFYRDLDGIGGPQCDLTVAQFSLYCLVDPQSAQWLHIMVLISVISGVVPRVTSWLHWWVAWSFSSTSNVVDGGDQLAANILFLVALLYLSDQRMIGYLRPASTGHFGIRIAYPAYLLLVVQFVVVYGHSTLAKLKVEEWVDGSALWYWAQSAMMPDTWPHSLVKTWLFGHPLGSIMATYSVLLLQSYLVLAIFLSWQFRRVALILGAIFHLGIAVMMGLWSFSVVMIAFEVLVLIRPNEAPLKRISNHSCIEFAS